MEKMLLIEKYILEIWARPVSILELADRQKRCGALDHELQVLHLGFAGDSHHGIRVSVRCAHPIPRAPPLMCASAAFGALLLRELSPVPRARDKGSRGAPGIYWT